MSSESLKKKTLKGSVWSVIDNVCGQGLAFVIGIVLARLLTPSDYGVVGVTAIFIAIANVFVDCGFGNALIRKKNRTQEDLSTAFYVNLAVGVVVYLALFVSSPFIASFFSMPILESMIRILALCVVFNSFSIVQNSILTANLKIKTIAIVNIGTQIPMGAISIYFAYVGFGVWTLVIQQLGSSLLKTVLLWLISNWHPSLIFCKQSFKYLYDFGWKLVSSNLLGTFFNEMYGFVIGRFLGASDLGLYSKSKALSGYPNTIITNIINRVVLPVMVEMQGDTNKVRGTYIRMIELLSFVTFPLFGILIVIAHPLIITMWTDKWEESVFLFQLFCIGCSLAPISSLNVSLLQLLNRMDILLKLELLKKPICFALLLVSIPFGLKGIVIFAVIYNFIGLFINMYPTKNLLNYPYKSQICDIIKYLSVTIIAVVSSFIMLHIIDVHNDWIEMIFGTIIVFGVYISLCVLLRMDGLQILLNMRCLKKN